MKAINKSWAFWKPIVTKKDGTINISQVKKELSDYYKVLDFVPKVYCHITGGILSKVLYDPVTVTSKADEHYAEIHKSVFKEMLDDLLATKHISKKAHELLSKEVDVYL